jgi:hypothetical protein
MQSTQLLHCQHCLDLVKQLAKELCRDSFTNGLTGCLGHVAGTGLSSYLILCDVTIRVSLISKCIQWSSAYRKIKMHQTAYRVTTEICATKNFVTPNTNGGNLSACYLALHYLDCPL